MEKYITKTEYTTTDRYTHSREVYEQGNIILEFIYFQDFNHGGDSENTISVEFLKNKEKITLLDLAINDAEFINSDDLDLFFQISIYFYKNYNLFVKIINTDLFFKILHFVKNRIEEEIDFNFLHFLRNLENKKVIKIIRE